MITQIILKKDWKVLKEYNFVFTMCKYDIVTFESIDYIVCKSFLDIDENKMIIIVE